MARMQLYTLSPHLEFSAHKYANWAMPPTLLTSAGLQQELTCAVTFQTEKYFITRLLHARQWQALYSSMLVWIRNQFGHPLESQTARPPWTENLDIAHANELRRTALQVVWIGSLGSLHHCCNWFCWDCRWRTWFWIINPQQWHRLLKIKIT